MCVFVGCFQKVYCVYKAQSDQLEWCCFSILISKVAVIVMVALFDRRRRRRRCAVIFDVADYESDRRKREIVCLIYIYF